MAENGKNLLHTHSGYAHHYIDTSFIGKLERENNFDAVTKMQAKEEELYKQFKASNFQQFRTNLLNFFTEADITVIRNFEAKELEKRLKVYALSQRDLYEYKDAIELHFDFTDLEKIDGLNLAVGKSKNEKLKFTIFEQKKIGSIKDIVNKTFGRHFHTGKDYSKNIDTLIHSLMSNGILQVKLGKESGGVFEYKEDYVMHTIPNFPWGLTKDIYDTAVKNHDTVILQEVGRAIATIYDFLYNILGGEPNVSMEMKQAIRNVWIKHFSSGTNPAMFFSGGKTSSFISGVQGALGEFQSALIFEYLSLKSDNNAFAKIKGNTRLLNTATKEQARTDVEIFQAFGLQVKNFITIEQTVENQTSTRFLQDIYTRIHPSKLAEYFDSGIREDFLGFMANFYFNKTYYSDEFSKMWQLRTNLENWLGEIMNMAVNDAVEDTVTFYVIGGKYMVPCSAILEAADQLDLKGSLRIQSAYYGLTNEQFQEVDKNGVSNAAKYWTKESGYWKATEENKKLFNNLISSSISIQTNFNFFEKIKDYALW